MEIRWSDIWPQPQRRKGKVDPVRILGERRDSSPNFLCGALKLIRKIGDKEWERDGGDDGIWGAPESGLR